MSKSLADWCAEIDRNTNPLARELEQKHDATLDALFELLGRSCDVIGPCGYGFDGPVSDEQARQATIDLRDSMLTIDVEGDIADQVSTWLRKLGRRCLKAAKRLEIAASAGTFPLPPYTDSKTE